MLPQEKSIDAKAREPVNVHACCSVVPSSPGFSCLLAKLSRQLICAAQFRDADSGAFFAGIALLTPLAGSEHLAIWPLPCLTRF